MFIGIDLGTTNSGLSFADPKEGVIRTFAIPQSGEGGTPTLGKTLPSFIHVGEKGRTVGAFARAESATSPLTVASSAKSWLCHHTHARLEKILPEGCEDAHLTLSPVEAQTEILRHLKQTFEAQFPESPFSEQLVVLAVPASFDEMARELTLKAAHDAGMPHILLLEEPQAAFYSFLSEMKEFSFEDGARILVVDVGGGTTDFSLIDVARGSYQRRAVGEHLLLGGDNMDLFIAHALQKKIGRELNIREWAELKSKGRGVKEMLFTPDCPETISVELLGTGSKVVGGSLKVTLERDALKEALLESFWKVLRAEEVTSPAKKSAMLTLGLPYEQEPNILLHLMRFLKAHASDKSVDYILFNGSQMAPEEFRARVLRQVGGKVLPSEKLDLAVARGAVQYALARAGKAERIGGGAPRSYYLEVETPEGAKALTILERGKEEDALSLCPVSLSAAVGQPARFSLYASSVRLQDVVGDLVALPDENLTLIAPLSTTLAFGKAGVKRTVEVRFQARLSAVGVLEAALQATETPHLWKLSFQTRSSLGADLRQEEAFVGESLDEESLKGAKDLVEAAFQPGGDPKLLVKRLEEALEKPKWEWSLSLLRQLYDLLIGCKESRKLTLEHRVRFWNLAGFLLRPGLGAPCDDFRLQELWRLLLEERREKLPLEIEVQHWIALRRISAGLKAGQQAQVAPQAVKDLFERKNAASYLERLRAFAALEKVSAKEKERIGKPLLEKAVQGRAHAAELWALGRLGARRTASGSIEFLVQKELCERWVDALLKSPQPEVEQALSLLIADSGLKQADLSPETKRRVFRSFPGLCGQTPQNEPFTTTFFGDRLPIGLYLKNMV